MLRIAPLLSTFDPASLYSFVSSSSESFHVYPSNFGRFILYRYGMRDWQTPILTNVFAENRNLLPDSRKRAILWLKLLRLLHSSRLH